MRLINSAAVAVTAIGASAALTACAATAIPHSASLAASSTAVGKVTVAATAKPSAAAGTEARPRCNSLAIRTAMRSCLSRPGRSTPATRITSSAPESRPAAHPAAVVRAVAKGGIITFNCGPKPVTITMNATAKVVNTSNLVVLDGGGLVTLSGGGKREILYMDTCDPKQIWTTDHCINQEWPELVVENMTFEDGYSPIKETAGTPYGGGGGGAIYAEGGQLKVVNSRFIDNRCYRVRARSWGRGDPCDFSVEQSAGLHH